MAVKKLTETSVGNMRVYELRDTEIKGFVIRKRSADQKFFYYIYWINKRRRTYTIGRYGDLTVSTARDVAKDKAGLVARGIDPLEHKEAAIEATRKAKDIIFENFLVGRYKELVTAETHKRVESICRNQFPHLYKKKLTAITSNDIEKWKQGYKGKKSGCNTMLDAFSGFFTKAIGDGLIEENPISSVARWVIDDKKAPRFLSNQEEKRLRKSLDERQETQIQKRERFNKWLLERKRKPKPDLRGLKYTDYLKPMTLLTLKTGLRRGEVFNLRRRDIDMDRKLLVVVGSGAKSGKSRFIPLSKEVQQTLKDWLRERNIKKGSEIVFPNPNTGKRFDNIKKSWKELMERAGIKNFTFHDLRHTFGTRLVRNNVDLETVRDLMGHEDIKTTQIYTHTDSETKFNAISKLD